MNWVDRSILITLIVVWLARIGFDAISRRRLVRALDANTDHRRLENDTWEEQIRHLVELKRCMDGGEPIPDELWLAVNKIVAP